MADAMTFGELMRSLMREQGLSLRGLARKAHCNHGHLSKISRDQCAPSEDYAKHLDKILKANGRLSALVPKKAKVTYKQGAESNAWTVAPISDSGQLRAARDMGIMEAFRAADRQIGGGRLYPTVVNYLNTAIGPRLFGGTDDYSDRTVFACAGAMTEMAGWMAYDGGRGTIARQHFERSLKLASAGNDFQLKAQIYASMSHLYLHMGKPDRAIQLAQTGQVVLKRNPVPSLSARLLAMEARGLADHNEPTACMKALVRAERTLSKESANTISPWLSPFDEASLASEAARSMLRTSQLPNAETRARMVIRMRSETHTRSRAFGQLLLVAALIAQDELEEACIEAARVLSVADSLSSSLVVEQLQAIRESLLPHRSFAPVAMFLDKAHDPLRGWMPTYRTHLT
ncbi:hypothetical protein Acsp03_55390 [Actinomadura sp. NBRC 104412]|uniref:helix-turn-helix domain-containing protein n=1 Tax=Actinomadura sp. NBRC 104412 TaxID=3032203 RepID=UPI0024A4EEE8|nr:helix-turn-helix transcriptional regulator [Actinomadura sp. NBRC 104412]GLZ08073.1 hypothetical protein Acsp03_55390 [Actinomadura sp. NBRC 104412]